MYGFRVHSDKAELWGRTEYGESVSVELVPRDKPGSYDLGLTLAGGEQRRYLFSANDAEFLGNKLQFKGPFLRIVLDQRTAGKFRAFLDRST